MLHSKSPLAQLQESLASGAETPTSVARACLARANGNASRNTYLWLNEASVMSQALDLERRFANVEKRPPLYGIPVSLKDCFDLAGTVTTAGTKFYAQRSGVASRDSAVAERLRAAGMLIVGKTHMHGLAYGITGENPDYGDCVQPRDPRLLTGGSSSGAAASVQEGSAVVGIGTDTGGSVRVPAALCGLVGYRASHRLAFEGVTSGLWTGGVHLSETFDTVGIFVQDPRDLGVVADALFAVGSRPVNTAMRVGCVAGEFLADCEPEVMASLKLWRQRMAMSGANVETFEPQGWEEAQEMFAPIQASEAALLHRGNFDAFEPAVAQRLRWGAALPESEVAELRARMEGFRTRMLGLFERFDVVMLPCAPVRQLLVEEDQSGSRAKILKYTTPFSMGGLPAVSLPGEMVGGALGSGVQVAARPGQDAQVLEWAGMVAKNIAQTSRLSSQ